jgi:hypothetical protein
MEQWRGGGLGSRMPSIMKRAVLALANALAATLLVGGAIAQAPPANEEVIPSRSINLSAQQDYIIKENLKDIHIEQVPRTNEIRIGDKVPPNIELHAFPPHVVEKVPQVKTYKFFITENQIVVVNPQNLVADIIK